MDAHRMKPQGGGEEQEESTRVAPEQARAPPEEGEPPDPTALVKRRGSWEKNTDAVDPGDALPHTRLSRKAHE
jgi:hypothetical protein